MGAPQVQAAVAARPPPPPLPTAAFLCSQTRRSQPQKETQNAPPPAYYRPETAWQGESPNSPTAQQPKSPTAQQPSLLLTESVGCASIMRCAAASRRLDLDPACVLLLALAPPPPTYLKVLHLPRWGYCQRTAPSTKGTASLPPPPLAPAAFAKRAQQLGRASAPLNASWQLPWPAGV